jgi:D-alanyl-D-alanine carboxypeptidase (penicillin-binding protein 5/6)
LRLKSLLTFALLTVAAAAHGMPIPAPPQFDAKSYVLMDVNSGQIVAAYNQDQHREPASLTKLMAAYVVFHALKDGVIHLDDTAVVSERAWRMGGSRMFAELHSHVSVDNLLQGMLVQSGNDATVALAERVAGTEDAFVEIMNQYAAKLGMQDSHFLDSSGDTDNVGITPPRGIWRCWRAPSSASSRNISTISRRRISCGTASTSRIATTSCSAIPAWTA